MGREKQPEIDKFSPSGYKKDRRTWSQKWEDRANQGLPGPPPGIPVGRAGGGEKPAALGDLDEGKLFPHQLWRKDHEAKFRLGQIGPQGRALKLKHGAALARPGDKHKNLSLLLNTVMGRELLTDEAEIERGKREWEKKLQDDAARRQKALEGPRIQEGIHGEFNRPAKNRAEWLAEEAMKAEKEEARREMIRRTTS